MHTLRDDVPDLLSDLEAVVNMDLTEIMDTKLKYIHEELDDVTTELELSKEYLDFMNCFLSIFTYPEKNVKTIYSFRDDPYVNAWKTGKTLTDMCQEDLAQEKSILVHELVHIIDYNYHGIQAVRIDISNEIDLVEEMMRDEGEDGDDYEDLKAQYEFREGLEENLKIVLESHAEYVRGRWLEKHCPGVSDMLDKKGNAPLWEEDYIRGFDIIDEVYKKDLPIRLLYENIPHTEDFDDIDIYFSRKDVTEYIALLS